MNRKKWMQIGGTAFNYFIAMVLIVSGLLKLIGIKGYVEMINDLSPYYGNNIHLLGITAVIAGVLLIIPRYFFYGFILSLVFFGGTISAHMQHGDNYLPQVIFVLLTVAVAHIKKPTWYHPSIA